MQPDMNRSKELLTEEENAESLVRRTIEAVQGAMKEV